MYHSSTLLPLEDEDILHTALAALNTVCDDGHSSTVVLPEQYAREVC